MVVSPSGRCLVLRVSSRTRRRGERGEQPEDYPQRRGDDAGQRGGQGLSHGTRLAAGRSHGDREDTRRADQAASRMTLTRGLTDVGEHLPRAGLGSRSEVGRVDRLASADSLQAAAKVATCAPTDASVACRGGVHEDLPVVDVFAVARPARRSCRLLG